MYVDYTDLNKASPRDDFPLPNIHILLDNCAKYEIASFLDWYVGYHHNIMDDGDVEKMSFSLRGVHIIIRLCLLG